MTRTNPSSAPPHSPRRLRHVALKLSFGPTTLALGPVWLLVAPLGLWAVAAFYLPIVAPALDQRDRIVVTLIIGVLAAATLLGHGLAHLLAARATRSALPPHLPLYLFGDAAHVWPAAASAWREALVAGAAPLAHLLFAGLGYFVWDRQLHPYVNASALFLVLGNAGLAVVNLTPGFPLDGGRLARAIVSGTLHRPDWGDRLGLWLGCALWVALAVWGVGLISTGARFSGETGGGSILVAALLLLPLWLYPVARTPAPPPAPLSRAGRVGRGLLASLLILGLLSISAGLTPTANGVYAPGFAIAVAPMVEVASDRRYPSTGSFFLTTVIAQTPITAGQWLYAQFSPAFTLVPPERVVPPDITPQELVEQSFAMLQTSEMVATVVGLQRAGFAATISQRVAVIAVVPGSPAEGRLRPGDRIIAVNGAPIADTQDLVAQVTAQTPPASLEVRVERDGQPLTVTVALPAPADPADPPRLGIQVQEADAEVELPFAVTIRPEKIIGGPSAGLMFALTVYDLVTPGDLTGGRRIAGTGTIDRDGVVGPIGGVEQKVAGAEWAGADYFLVPLANAAAAQRVAQRIEVVPVATIDEAIAFLNGLPAGE